MLVFVGVFFFKHLSHEPRNDPVAMESQNAVISCAQWKLNNDQIIGGGETKNYG